MKINTARLAETAMAIMTPREIPVDSETSSTTSSASSKWASIRDWSKVVEDEISRRWFRNAECAADWMATVWVDGRMSEKTMAMSVRRVAMETMELRV